MIDKLKQINKNAPVQARASFWFLVCSALQQGINVIITPIYTRIMSEGQYGGYGAYTSWYSILSIIVTLNMGEGVYQRGIVKYEDEKEEFSSSLQSLTLVLCILWFGVYFIFRNSLNSFLSLTTYQMTGMFVTMWTNAVYIFWMTEQRTQYRYRAMVAISLSVSAVQAILGISSVYFFEDKVTARILSFAGVNLVFYIWLFFSQMFRGKVFFSKRFWAHALSFCIPLIPHFLSTVILQSSDRIMIQKLAGDREAGIYTLGSAIALVMSIFNSAISHTMSPW
ncbi:MAG: oligosaccharide flippase family protein, partial [Lachnospiraceae bacterium]|nr:oligosaccharide flippase family protein [Lachnospiraceae bacterium]